MANFTRKLHVKLKKKDREFIDGLLKKGTVSVRILRRAQVLDLLDRGYSSNQIAPVLNVTPETARRTGWKYVRSGLNKAIQEPSRPGKERALNKKQSNQIIAMVCGAPPEGRARWTLELIASEAKRQGIVKTVGRETIRLLLHTHDLKPWREKNVVYSG